ncbi:MAG: hypothetical protein IJZ57_06095 [Clostridia bacterium]|nr:hypothetical protein [Clostridia bacterium]
MSDYTLVVGIITILFTLAIFVVSLVLKAPVWVPVIWVVFSLLGFSLIIAWKNVRTIYNEDEIIYKNFWGKKRRFLYSDFVGYTGIVGKTDMKYITVDGHKLIIDQRTAAPEIHKLIKTKYEELHNERFPKLEPKKDIFNNNLRDPEGFIVTFVFVLLIPVVLSVVMLIWGGEPITQAECEKAIVSVEDYHIAEGDFYFYSDGYEEYFAVYDYEKYVSDLETFEGLYKSGNSFEVLCKYHEPFHGRPAYYDVCSITFDEKELLAFESINEKLEKQGLLIMVFLSIAFLLILVVALIHIIIARHPEKFNPKLVRFFFKEGSFVKYNYGRD